MQLIVQSISSLGAIKNFIYIQRQVTKAKDKELNKKMQEFKVKETEVKQLLEFIATAEMLATFCFINKSFN